MDAVPARDLSGRSGHPDWFAAAEVYFNKNSGYFFLSRENDENKVLAKKTPKNVDVFQQLIRLTGSSWQLSSWLPPEASVWRRLAAS